MAEVVLAGIVAAAIAVAWFKYPDRSLAARTLIGLYIGAVLLALAGLVMMMAMTAGWLPPV